MGSGRLENGRRRLGSRRLNGGRDTRRNWRRNGFEGLGPDRRRLVFAAGAISLPCQIRHDHYAFGANHSGGIGQCIDQGLDSKTPLSVSVGVGVHFRTTRHQRDRRFLNIASVIGISDRNLNYPAQESQHTKVFSATPSPLSATRRSVPFVVPKITRCPISLTHP